jgi:hypothetical protein
MKHPHIELNSWEVMAPDRRTWTASINEGYRLAGEDRSGKRDNERKFCPLPAVFTCTPCDRTCACRIGLFCDIRACKEKISSLKT